MTSNLLQVAALILAIIGVVELGKGKSTYWFAACGQNVFSGLAFLSVGIWGQVFTHFIFFLQCLWGMRQWLSNGEPKTDGYTSYSTKQVFISLSCTILMVAISYFLLDGFSKSSFVLLDSLLVGVSITGHYLAGKGVIQQWWFWHATNLFGIALCVSSGLYISTLMFFVFGVLAIKGHLHWKSELTLKALNAMG